MSFVLGNIKPFPKNGLTYGETENGWYLAKDMSGDFVAFHVTNIMGMPEEPNSQWFDSAEVTDHTWNTLDTSLLFEYAPIKFDNEVSATAAEASTRVTGKEGV